MALVIGEENTREILVELVQPLKGGKTKTHHVLAEFEVMDTATWRELLSSQQPVIEVALASLVALPMTDTSGQDVALTDDTKALLLNTRWIHAGLIDGFMAVQSGISSEAYKKAKLKN
jgi:hypothetical protein